MGLVPCYGRIPKLLAALARKIAHRLKAEHKLDESTRVMEAGNQRKVVGAVLDQSLEDEQKVEKNPAVLEYYRDEEAHPPTPAPVNVKPRVGANHQQRRNVVLPPMMNPNKRCKLETITHFDHFGYPQIQL